MVYKQRSKNLDRKYLLPGHSLLYRALSPPPPATLAPPRPLPVAPTLPWPHARCGGESGKDSGGHDDDGGGRRRGFTHAPRCCCLYFCLLESSARRGCMGRGRWESALGRRPECSARKGGGAESLGVLQTTTSTKVPHIISIHLFTPFGQRTRSAR
jgi:hypothetical protein